MLVRDDHDFIDVRLLRLRVLVGAGVAGGNCFQRQAERQYDQRDTDAKGARKTAFSHWFAPVPATDLVVGCSRIQGLC